MAWKKEALAKQLKFKESLGIVKSGTFGKDNKPYLNILHPDNAKNGANFYCYNNPIEWQTLKEWANKDKGKKVDFTGLGLSNMLRSEHIPFNFFYPLEKLRNNNPEFLNSFLEKLLDNNIKVDKITRIKIEFTSNLHKSKLLDDNTSFDAYIEYLDGNKKCGLGIEVKYTEKSYPYGITEKKRMLDKDSEYNRITRDSKFYNVESISKLREKKLKQLWRNHLLGIKLVELKELDQFHSVYIYPQGNTYQKEACDKYLDCLVDNKKQSFVLVTFEKFISVASDVLSSEEHKEWIAYLKKRY
ncbi:MAG: hypothetical protein L3J34_04145 [Flavobacteriaceae bacterium]|nr:hypothetical protein [Flavobacteriaceae bacterium]